MEELLKDILSELQAIHKKLDIIDGDIVAYNAADAAADILKTVHNIETKL